MVFSESKMVIACCADPSLIMSMLVKKSYSRMLMVFSRALMVCIALPMDPITSGATSATAARMAAKAAATAAIPATSAAGLDVASLPSAGTTSPITPTIAAMPPRKERMVPQSAPLLLIRKIDPAVAAIITVTSPSTRESLLMAFTSSLLAAAISAAMPRISRMIGAKPVTTFVQSMPAISTAIPLSAVMASTTPARLPTFLSPATAASPARLMMSTSMVPTPSTSFSGSMFPSTLIGISSIVSAAAMPNIPLILMPLVSLAAPASVKISAATAIPPCTS